MLIIGELINCTRKKVGEAAQKRDVEFFKDLARRQAGAGANMLDVNGDLPGQDGELLSWLAFSPTPLPLECVIHLPGAV